MSITGDFVNGLHLMVGLSTDIKPETTSENSFFLEEDTGDIYYFSDGEWAEADAAVAGIVAALLNKGALPAVTATDNGKVLGVTNGAWGLVSDGTGGLVPVPTTYDAGKILTVDELGAYALVTIPAAESEAF